MNFEEGEEDGKGDAVDKAVQANIISSLVTIWIREKAADKKYRWN